MSIRILILKDGVITPTRSPSDNTAIVNSLESSLVTSVNGSTGAITLTKSSVGLNLVDNTSDVDKPVSTAQQTALNLKANIASPTFTGTVGGITSAMVGLGSVINSLQLVASNNLSDLVNRQTALNNISGGVTTGNYLRANGTNVVLSAIQAGDVPTLNQNTTGTAGNVTGIVSLTNGGTGATTQQAAINALVGNQTANRVLKSNGVNMILAQVDLTTDIIGSLPITNGTNFVNLTTDQTIAGTKTLSGLFRVSNTTQSTSTSTGASIISGGQAVVGNQYIGGFTSLGDNIAIKQKQISGTTGAINSDVSIVHNITNPIRQVTCIVTDLFDRLMAPGMTLTGAKNEYYVYTTPTHFFLHVPPTNSDHVANRPFVALITYSS